MCFCMVSSVVNMFPLVICIIYLAKFCAVHLYIKGANFLL